MAIITMVKDLDTEKCFGDPSSIQNNYVFREYYIFYYLTSEVWRWDSDSGLHALKSPMIIFGVGRAFTVANKLTCVKL